MYPELLQIGPVILYSYGFMMALGFVGAAFVAAREFGRRGLEPGLVYDLALVAAVGGIVGARLAFVANNWMLFAVRPGEIFAIWQGGLVWYGGFIGGGLAMLAVVRWRGLPPWTVADVSAPALAAGAAIGRLGCFLNGCCGGIATRMPWGVRFPTDVVPHRLFDLGGLEVQYFTTRMRPGTSAVHPTQLYEALYNVVLFAVLWRLRGRGLRDGALFWMYVIGYSISRFVVETWRTNPNLLGPLSGSQMVSIGLFAFGAVMLGVWLAPGEARAGEDGPAGE